MHRSYQSTRTTTGRFVVTAVAVGAVSAAAQQVGAAGDDVGVNRDVASLAFTGMGGNRPEVGVLPLPEMLPPARYSVDDELADLAKGQDIADRRSAARRDAEARAAADRGSRPASPGAPNTQASPGTGMAPTTGRITSNYGPRWGTTHYGLDIANDIGTPIVSVMDGEVIDSGPASGFGLWVRIRHDDGTITVYGHINETLVSEGQRVTAGEQIATVGNRGYSTGPHLHFEVHLGGERKTDPLAWLEANGIQSDGETL